MLVSFFMNVQTVVLCSSRKKVIAVFFVLTGQLNAHRYKQTEVVAVVDSRSPI